MIISHAHTHMYYYPICSGVHNITLLGGSVCVGCMLSMHQPRGVWGHAPPGNFSFFRCSEVNFGAICMKPNYYVSCIRQGPMDAKLSMTDS